LKRLLLLALVLSAPALAQLNPPIGYPSSTRTLTTASGTCEDGATSVVVSTLTSGTVGLGVSGTYSGVLALTTKTGATPGATLYASGPLATPVGGGTAVSTLANGATGQWTIPVSGSQTLCVAFNGTSVTGSAVVTLNSSAAPAPSNPTTNIGTVVTNIHATSTRGTGIACNSGTSPCNVAATVSAANQNVLNANTQRTSCSIVYTGANTLYCEKAAYATTPATSTTYDFQLSSTTMLGWNCDSPGGVWQGALNCLSSASDSSKNTTVMENQ
jgi:hypothetical protein